MNDIELKAIVKLMSYLFRESNTDHSYDLIKKGFV